MPTIENGSIKIVFVEDDKFKQSVLQKYFANSFSVVVFSDGLHGLSYLQEGNIPDLIVTDLNSPNLGGLALIKQIKASDFFSSIPTVVLSGKDSSEMIVTCIGGWYTTKNQFQ